MRKIFSSGLLAPGKNYWTIYAFCGCGDIEIFHKLKMIRPEGRFGKGKTFDESAISFFKSDPSKISAPH